MSYMNWPGTGQCEGSKDKTLFQDSRGLTAVPSAEQKDGRRRLIVLTGPTAVGKGTVEAQLRQDHPEVWVSVSATTRAPRPGEKDGVTYWFLSEEEFARRQAAGEFLETALVHGMSHYGTPLKPVLQHLAEGQPTILEIDLQGAHRVRQCAPSLGLEVVYVFLAPPTFDDLIIRLNERGTETAEERRKRLETAQLEMASQSEFDVTIVNDTVKQAASALWEIIAREYNL
ncbi:guanylate kinase [Bombiscardovia coagulans]|uniref:Guanylate kinase n=2 Tax=Bombiscardovia coagulans TaxID=686666 RepID=A0A261ETE8_9BIFI|nr:guanylate kinase [Bombiscardovia coagulans]